MLHTETLLWAFNVRRKTWPLGALVDIASASTRLIIPIAGADDFADLQHKVQIVPLHKVDFVSNIDVCYGSGAIFRELVAHGIQLPSYHTCTSHSTNRKISIH